MFSPFFPSCLPFQNLRTTSFPHKGFQIYLAMTIFVILIYPKKISPSYTTLPIHN